MEVIREGRLAKRDRYEHTGQMEQSETAGEKCLEKGPVLGSSSPQTAPWVGCSIGVMWMQKSPCEGGTWGFTITLSGRELMGAGSPCERDTEGCRGFQDHPVGEQ